MKTLWIIGAGGHGKVAADIARKTGYGEIAFLDDRDGLTSCGGYPVRGKTALLRELEELRAAKSSGDNAPKE